MNAPRKIALSGLLTAVCFLLSYVEMLLQLTNSPIPGIKVGLANICILFALYRLGGISAVGINFARILLCWLFFGNLSSAIYSLAGAAISLSVEAILIKTKRFSPVGVSAAGGAAHNFGQLLVAMLILGPGAVYYFPLLILSGTALGAVNGIILSIILSRTQKFFKQ